MLLLYKFDRKWHQPSPDLRNSRGTYQNDSHALQIVGQCDRRPRPGLDLYKLSKKEYIINY